jgi:hypothetical protein
MSSRAASISFGERVAVVNDLLGGRMTRENVCEWFRIDNSELDRWVRIHARDRLVFIDEFRRPAALHPDLRGLQSQVRKLEALLRARKKELSLLRQIARLRGLI